MTWTTQSVEEHFASVRMRLDQQRKDHGSARVVIDLSAVVVQARTVAERLQIDLERTYLSDDRIAIVTRSALLRMQMRRMRVSAEVRTFEEVEEAERWLAGM